MRTAWRSSAEDPHSDIHLWINSPGGSVPMMHAIADVIETLPNDVVTVAFGWAASAGQFVLMMGTPGKRLALPHARILLHQGSSGIGGAAADIELQSGDRPGHGPASHRRGDGKDL